MGQIAQIYAILNLFCDILRTVLQDLAILAQCQ